jgi:hypothetical protein
MELVTCLPESHEAPTDVKLRTVRFSDTTPLIRIIPRIPGTKNLSSFRSRKAPRQNRCPHSPKRCASSRSVSESESDNALLPLLPLLPSLPPVSFSLTPPPRDTNAFIAAAANTRRQSIERGRTPSRAWTAAVALLSNDMLKNADTCASGAGVKRSRN